MARDPGVTSRIMAAVRSRDTKPELALRRELHARGLRYRLGHPIVGKPDIVFVRARLAVFVDGDFWHGYGWRERGFDSMEAQFTKHANPEKWRAKIRGNMERDQEVNSALQAQGWTVYRVLESRVNSEVEAVACEIVEIVKGR